MPVSKKRIAGVGVSIGLFAMAGLMIGTASGAFTGVSLTEPVDKLATGPTRVPVGAAFFDPFGLSPTAVGLPPDAAIILPAIPVAVELFGVTLSVSGMTMSDISIGGGAAFGLLVGLYYVLVFAYEDYRDG